ncbi:sugar transport protein 13 [Tanacetum coccineum]
MSNSFSVLEEDDVDDSDWNESDKNNDTPSCINGSDSDDDDVEELIMEEQLGKRVNVIETEMKGASTPVTDESHARDSNLTKLCSSVFKCWDWTSNGNLCTKGTRIILGWNNYDNDLSVISQSDQVVHVRIWLKLEKKDLLCSFVYGHNRYTHRRPLWENLCIHKNYVRNRPWCLLGDFNASLFLDDSTAGSSTIDIAMREFKECVDDIEVMDIPSTGLRYTWNQKPKGSDGLLKKIDRVMGNTQFSDMFVGAHALFQPYRTSDHSPVVLKVPTAVKSNPKPFKFSNILTQHVKFKEVVNEGWNIDVSGFCMFRVVKKLKNLKTPFRKLLYDHGNLHDNVNRLRTELDKVQADLDLDPFNVELRDEEAAYVQAYNNALLMQEHFLRQKCPVLDNTRAVDMIRDVCDAEIKEAMFSMGNDKSPGPDGYTAAFFKEVWDVVGNDVCGAVREFFVNGKLLKELNHTIIALIPKVHQPTRVNDYRPISCCNVLFKCISKIIANRIKGSLHCLISPNQSAFVPGRSISDNILLTHELMHNYHLDRGEPRCAFKVDIQKAYDTVD